MGLHIFRVSLALGVCCECAPQNLKVYRHSDPYSFCCGLNSTAQPIFRTHRRAFLAREHQGIWRGTRVLFSPHLEQWDQEIRDGHRCLATLRLRLPWSQATPPSCSFDLEVVAAPG